MSENWTVYGLIDPRDGTIFYVGMSSAIGKRIPQHSTDLASQAYWRCRSILEDGVKVGSCIFGRDLGKLEAKIMEGRLIWMLPHVVNKKSFHGLPSSLLYPDWQDLRLSFTGLEISGRRQSVEGKPYDPSTRGDCSERAS